MKFCLQLCYKHRKRISFGGYQINYEVVWIKEVSLLTG